MEENEHLNIYNPAWIGDSAIKNEIWQFLKMTTMDDLKNTSLFWLVDH